MARRKRARRRGWTNEQADDAVDCLSFGMSIRAAERRSGIGRGQINYAMREWDKYAGHDGGGTAASKRVLDFGERCHGAIAEFAEAVVKVARSQTGRRPSVLLRYYSDGVAGGAWESGSDPMGNVERWSRYLDAQGITDEGLDLATLSAEGESDGG